MAQLTGLARIGRAAEVRFTTKGDAITNLSLAFSWGQKDQSGNRQTQWVDGALWGKRAESLSPYLLKGTLVYVVLDDAHIETFQKRDGGEGTKLAGTVSVIEFAARPQAEDAVRHHEDRKRPGPAMKNDYARESQSAHERTFGDDSIPF